MTKFCGLNEKRSSLSTNAHRSITDFKLSGQSKCSHLEGSKFTGCVTLKIALLTKKRGILKVCICFTIINFNVKKMSIWLFLSKKIIFHGANIFFLCHNNNFLTFYAMIIVLTVFNDSIILIRKNWSVNKGELLSQKCTTCFKKVFCLLYNLIQQNGYFWSLFLIILFEAAWLK